VYGAKRNCLSFRGRFLVPCEANGSNTLIFCLKFVELKILDIDHLVSCFVYCSNQFVQLQVDGAASRFCVFWIRNTMRNVTIVVPVLMTSCHVSSSEKSVR
jgi:hypothetical protein